MTYQIYTGYQWRPMNDDELEIMCRENIVPFKSKYPEAGEIVEEADTPYSPEDYADAKAQGLDLDDWNEFQQYCKMGPWEDAE